nr:MAG TPA: hypothetical protein [Caudoviricetes sp.]
MGRMPVCSVSMRTTTLATRARTSGRGYLFILHLLSHKPSRTTW